VSEELHFEPMPGTEFLCSDPPTIIVDLIGRNYPPGTPAPPLRNRPRLPRKDNNSLPPNTPAPAPKND